MKNSFTASRMKTDKAIVAMASGSTPWRSIGSTSRRLKPQPRSSIVTAKPISTAAQKGRPILAAASMKKAGSMTNSPCAKLIVCEVCQSRVKPIATSA